MSAKAYTTFWLCLLALPAFAWYMVTLGPVRGAAFELLTPETVYLANLREPEIACRTLRLRRPQAVVTGDSHSYAAWDFIQLERRLRMRIGACALGGLYAESVPQLLEYVLREAPRTRLIVLGLSPRMFWESPTKQEQLDFHRYLLQTMPQDATAFFRRAILREVLPRDDESEAVRRHQSRIEALDESALKAQLERSTKTVRSLRDWRERLERVQFASDSADVARKICAVVRASGARLWVLHIPESPYLEARYSREIWERYAQAVNALAPCAEKLLLDRATSYGLGNRHYVNRPLKDTHDYASWKQPIPLADDVAFDADHLNPVGARRFTARLLDRVGVEGP